MNGPIVWFPGHMAKARRQLQSSLSEVDAVIDLADLRIGGLTLSPAFSAATTTGYTAATTNATNTVTAIPADANATVEIDQLIRL